MQRVAIFGVGLIGGSFALALRKAGFQGEIIGVSSSRTIAEAVELGVIDRGAEPLEAAREADLIYLAQPVLTIIETLRSLGPEFRDDALVTDAGSTKSAIVAAARSSVRRALFLGGHPMAGKERRGVAAADPDLFVGRNYLLTPMNPPDEFTERVSEFKLWVEQIGALTAILSSDDHDRMVAYVSHAPQLLSTALAAVISQVPDAEKVAGPAVLEMTRLAASPFDVWKDIFATNRDNVVTAVTEVIQKLNQLTELVGKDILQKEFQSGAEGADLLRRRKSSSK